MKNNNLLLATMLDLTRFWPILADLAELPDNVGLVAG